MPILVETMDPLRIKDNSKIKKKDFSEIKNLEAKILNKTLKSLEQEGIFLFPQTISESQDIADSQTILQMEDGSYKTGNIMGFLGCGPERLIIKSRFSEIDDDDYFFQYLLSRVLDIPNVVNLETDSNNENSIINYLCFLFPYLLKVAIRKGIFKQYVCTEYNDSNVKGFIDIVRHIKCNTPFVGRIAYKQRTFSYDNYLLQLVRHTIEFIKNTSYGNMLLSNVKMEIQLIVDVTFTYRVQDRQTIINKNKKNLVRHAYYHEYRALQNLCILILQNQKGQIGFGYNTSYGILFDGAWLWEEYINLLIGNDFYHPKNKSRSGSEQLFSGDRQQGLIYPDFIGKDVSNRIIVDAKYKPIKNISGKDYLQVLAYMFRFDAKKGYYLYPDSEESGSKKLVLNQGTKYEENVSPREDIYVLKCGLKIPKNASSYNDFITKIETSEENFLKKLRC